MSNDITDEDLNRIANDKTAQELARKLLRQKEDLWDTLSDIEQYVGLEFDSGEIDHVLAGVDASDASDDRVRQMLRHAFAHKAVLDETGIVFEELPTDNQPIVEWKTVFVEAGEYNRETDTYQIEGEYPVKQIDGERFVVTDIERGDIPTNHAFVEAGGYSSEKGFETEGSYPIQSRDGKAVIYLESKSAESS